MTNIEQFTQQLMLAHDIEYIEAHRRATQFYDALDIETPPVLNDGWISIDDRLPDAYKHVIACDADGYITITFHNKQWRDENSDIGKVTHWQPLPPPPKD